MPNINEIFIALDGDRQVYKKGDVISGFWKIDVGEAFSIRAVRTTLQGTVYTRWEDVNARKDDKIGYEKIISEWRTLVKPTSGDQKLEVGKHKYTFKFTLPSDMLPSSYEGKYGAIRYWLRLEIDRPILRFNINRIKNLTVLDDIDVNLPNLCIAIKRRSEKKVYKALGLGDQGTVELLVQTDRGAYCPGEKIAISLTAANNSERDVGMIKVSLLQEVTFQAGGDTKYKTTILKTITGKEMKSKERRSWKDQLIAIPAVPPTTRDRSCYIVNVTYKIKALIDIPKIHGGDVVVCFPVTIGTVPQGHLSRSLQQASASNVIDLSSAITYTQCNAGFEEFTNSDGNNFPRTAYIPWCSYVPGFVYRPKQPVQKKPTVKPVTKPVTKSAPPTQRVVPPTSAVTPLQPSAPPSPPSYEDVMNEISREEKPSTDTSSIETSSTQSSADPGAKPVARPTTRVCLIVRFADRYLQQFRTCLSKHYEQLLSSSGRVIALAPQVLVTSGSWPAYTSIAVCLFEKQEDSVGWFSTFQTGCSDANIELSDAVLIQGRDEDFQTEKGGFVMGLSRRIVETTSPEYKEFAKLAVSTFKPLRLECGGVLLGVAIKAEHLVGDWPEDGLSLNVVQWDSINQRQQYIDKFKTEKYKPALASFKRCFKSLGGYLFQTESFSYLEEDNTETMSADYQNNTNHEATKASVNTKVTNADTQDTTPSANVDTSTRDNSTTITTAVNEKEDATEG